jgi:hypothetical protein
VINIVPPGDITLGQLNSLLPFSNTLKVWRRKRKRKRKREEDERQQLPPGISLWAS